MPIRSLAACVLVAAVAFAVTVDAVRAADESAPLELSVNAIDVGLVDAILRDGDVLIPLDALAGARLVIAKERATTIDGKLYVSLRSLAPAVAYRYDTAKLTVDVTADARLFASETYDLGFHRETTKAEAVRSAFLDYSLTGDSTGFGTTGASFDFGLGSAAGLFEATDSFVGGAFRRGLTSYSMESQDHLRRERIGDSATASSSLGSQTVLGGISVSRAFELQPSLVRFATGRLAGTVLTPSTADVYVNGQLIRAIQLQPGPFDLSDLPFTGGAVSTHIVLRDAYGGVTNVSSQFYVTNVALKKGLTDYSYSLGFLRASPFGGNDRYGPLVAIGSYRVGLTDALTVGGHVEAGAGVANAGPEIDMNTPIGQLSVLAQGSSAAGSRGFAASAQYQYESSRVGVELAATKRSDAYATVQTHPGDDRTTSELSASLSYRVSPAMSMSILDSSLVDRDNGRQSMVQLSTQVRLSHLVDLIANVARSQSPLSLGLTSATPRGATTSASIGLQFNIGNAIATTSERVDANGAQSEISSERSAPSALGVGYGFTADVGSQRSITSNVVAHTSALDAELDTYASGGANSANFGLSGALVAFGSGVFFTRPITDAYALVRVDGLTGVPVRYGGEEVGRIGRRGALVVPNLQAYEPNTISIDESQTAGNAVADHGESVVAPKSRTGVVANFEVRRLQVFVGSLYVVAGTEQVVPRYGVLTLKSANGATFESQLGESGEFYFEDLVAGTYKAQASFDRGTCDFRIDVTAPKDAISVDLGKLSCFLAH